MRPSWRDTLSDPAVAAVLCYSAAALVAIVAAYFALFTQFAGYDDEGTLLVTVKAFAQGHVLYRDIYSEYGPFYYELFGGLFALTGKAVTTDASRTIVVFLWTASSLLYGLAAHRLTGRLALGLVAMGSAFSALYVLEAEPMHPQGLCILLLAAFTALAVFGPGRRAGWLGAAGGVVVAALLLTKVNLGGFLLAAIVLAAVFALEPLRSRRWVLFPVTIAFLAMPPVVMARDVRQDSTRELLLLELLAFGALLLAAYRDAPAERDEETASTARWLLGAGVGFVVAAIAILVAIFLTGPSPADVYDGVITEALRVRDVLITPLNFPGAAVDWGVAAVAASALVRFLRPTFGTEPSLWPPLLRGLAGLTILLVVAHIVPIGLNPSSQNPIVLPVLLAWVAAVPPAGPAERTYKRFLRVLLPAVAVGETLQIYPVAGSQMGIAAATFVPVGALCLADSLAGFRAWSAARGAGALQRFGIAAVVVTVALAAQFTLDAMLRPGVANVLTYREREALPFPGATALHLPPEEVERYSRIVGLLHQYRCSTFIGYPNIDSFYLWSGIEPPPPRAPGAWINALGHPAQQRVVDELKASPRPCAIRSDEQAEAWLHGNPPPVGAPLVEYVFNDFRPVAQVDQFTFMLPKRQKPS